MFIHTLNLSCSKHSARFLSFIHDHFLTGLRFLDCLIIQRNQHFVQIVTLLIASSELGNRSSTSSSRLIRHYRCLYEERIAAPGTEVEKVGNPKLVEAKGIVPHLYQIVLAGVCYVGKLDCGLNLTFPCNFLAYCRA